MRTVTSRELDRHTGSVKRATRDEPAFVTTRGEPTHVLMTIDDYARMLAEYERRRLTPSAAPSGDTTPPTPRGG